MAFLGQRFNSNDLPEGNGFEPIPAGWYDAEIAKADVKPTKDTTGTRLNVQFKVTGPEHAGRVVFAGLNIELPNSPRAEEIGRQQFGDLLRSIGLEEIDDSDELVGHSVRIRVKITPETDQYEARNEVVGYRPSDEAGEREDRRQSKGSKGPGRRNEEEEEEEEVPPRSNAKTRNRRDEEEEEEEEAPRGKKPAPSRREEAPAAKKNAPWSKRR